MRHSDMTDQSKYGFKTIVEIYSPKEWTTFEDKFREVSTKFKTNVGDIVNLSPKVKLVNFSKFREALKQWEAKKEETLKQTQDISKAREKLGISGPPKLFQFPGAENLPSQSASGYYLVASSAGWVPASKRPTGRFESFAPYFWSFHKAKGVISRLISPGALQGKLEDNEWVIINLEDLDKEDIKVVLTATKLQEKDSRGLYIELPMSLKFDPKRSDIEALVTLARRVGTDFVKPDTIKRIAPGESSSQFIRYGLNPRIQKLRGQIKEATLEKDHFALKVVESIKLFLEDFKIPGHSGPKGPKLAKVPFSTEQDPSGRTSIHSSWIPDPNEDQPADVPQFGFKGGAGAVFGKVWKFRPGEVLRTNRKVHFKVGDTPHYNRIKGIVLNVASWVNYKSGKQLKWENHPNRTGMPLSFVSLADDDTKYHVIKISVAPYYTDRGKLSEHIFLSPEDFSKADTELETTGEIDLETPGDTAITVVYNEKDFIKASESVKRNQIRVMAFELLQARMKKSTHYGQREAEGDKFAARARKTQTASERELLTMYRELKAEELEPQKPEKKDEPETLNLEQIFSNIEDIILEGYATLSEVWGVESTLKQLTKVLETGKNMITKNDKITYDITRQYLEYYYQNKLYLTWDINLKEIKVYVKTGDTKSTVQKVRSLLKAIMRIQPEARTKFPTEGTVPPAFQDLFKAPDKPAVESQQVTEKADVVLYALLFPKKEWDKERIEGYLEASGRKLYKLKEPADGEFYHAILRSKKGLRDFRYGRDYWNIRRSKVKPLWAIRKGAKRRNKKKDGKE